MNKVHILILILLVAYLFTGCSGNKEKLNNKDNLPEWYGIQDDPNYVYSFGMDTKRGKELATDGAKTNAYYDAALYVNTKVETYIRNFLSEKGHDEEEIYKFIDKVVNLTETSKFFDIETTKQEVHLVDTENSQIYKAYVRISIHTRKAAIEYFILDQIEEEFGYPNPLPPPPDDWWHEKWEKELKETLDGDLFLNEAK